MDGDSVHSDATLTGHALHDAKRAMRLQVLAARDALAPDARDAASAAIAERVRALPSFERARCVLLTLPFRSEWDTRPLFAAAVANGAIVALPRVNGFSRMLDLHAAQDIARDTAAGYRGIPEPLADLPRVGIEAVDWVLVPGVAFDVRGRRLGYGGGYYDRLLAQLTPGVPRVAGAFDLQVVAQVPAAPHDLAVDVIVTERRLLHIAAAE
ncbi:MAG: 5-formyltetrahydrofolate cyclo-ligase [Burkholderiales bacterium]